MPDPSLPYVELYTDGACSPNPGWGGWGAILVFPQRDRLTKELFGGEAGTTNNRMELMGAIKGLEALKRPCRVRLTTDSKYLSNAFDRGWLRRWRTNGWRTAEGGAVSNVDLWKELDRLANVHAIEWQWVKGHGTHPENTRADALAVAAREACRRAAETA